MLFLRNHWWRFTGADRDFFCRGVVSLRLFKDSKSLRRSLPSAITRNVYQHVFKPLLVSAIVPFNWPGLLRETERDVLRGLYYTDSLQGNHAFADFQRAKRARIDRPKLDRNDTRPRSKSNSRDEEVEKCRIVGYTRNWKILLFTINIQSYK